MRLLVALLIIIVIALCAVLLPKQPNAGLPIVNAAYNPAAPDLLFAPCPLGPRNLPIQSERKA